MHYNYHTSDPIQDEGQSSLILYESRLADDHFRVLVGASRITDLTPQEWQDANEWFCSECEAFESATVQWTPFLSKLEGSFTHNWITYQNVDGKYSAGWRDDGIDVKFDADLSFAEMVEKAEAARFEDAQNFAAVALENKCGGDSLYARQWEGISDETIADFSAQDIIIAVRSSLRNAWDYQLPEWVEEAYRGIGFEAFAADSDYESALRAFLAKWQACKAEFSPLYGLAL